MQKTNLIIISLIIQFSYAANCQNIFVSPIGNDSNTGLTMDVPLQTLQNAISKVSATDTVFLLPGRYFQNIRIEGINGIPEFPIVVQSFAADSSSFAIIDGGSAPGMDLEQFGMKIQNSSWLVIQNLIFENCWTDVIPVRLSHHLTFRNCTFIGGRRVIYPKGDGCHHILVEKCYWEQDERVWSTWSWEELHHGSLRHFNGALFHPKETNGNFIIRHNIITNVFNAIRTRPSSIRQDGNGEIYGNTITNVRDNEFEPESWAWNLHFYHNRLHNIHKQFSIDDVQGGPIYIYGNVTTQDNDEYKKEIVSGIYKFKDGPLTGNCYVFNNSFYTEARVMKEGEATNRNMKHFNNAYYFFSGTSRFQISDWHSSFEFDYDGINQNWPPNILSHSQEEHGIITETIFRNPDDRNLRLHQDSPCIDAGKTMELPELGYIQPFEGEGVDIGAFEGEKLITGPGFMYRNPPGGDGIEETPRIVGYSIYENTMVLNFSGKLKKNSIGTNDVKAFKHNTPLQIQRIEFNNDAKSVHLIFNKSIEKNGLKVNFIKLPVSTVDVPATLWAADPMFSMFERSTYTPEIKPHENITVWPNPLSGEYINLSSIKYSSVQRIIIYNINGKRMKEIDVNNTCNTLEIKIDKSIFKQGTYIIHLESNKYQYPNKIFTIMP